MTRYHLSEDGTPRTCDAKPGNCPLGEESPHTEASSLAEARNWAERANEERYGLLTSAETPAKPRVAKPSWLKRLKLKKELEELQAVKRSLGSRLLRQENELKGHQRNLESAQATLDSFNEEKRSIEARRKSKSRDELLESVESRITVATKEVADHRWEVNDLTPEVERMRANHKSHFNRILDLNRAIDGKAPRN